MGIAALDQWQHALAHISMYICQVKFQEISIHLTQQLKKHSIDWPDEEQLQLTEVKVRKRKGEGQRERN